MSNSLQDDTILDLQLREDRRYAGTEYYRQYRANRKMSGNPIIDDRRRPGDRHIGTRKRSPSISKFDRGQFIAWDGEGTTDSRGKHRYTLLANSKGASIHNAKGISTRDAFMLLCTEGKKYPNGIHVIFAGGYDINMILGDIPIRELFDLWTNGHCEYEDYYVRWTPHKRFTLSHYSPVSRYKMHNGRAIPNYDSRIQLWDCFGFFQSSFVDGLDNWLPGEVPEIEIIRSMKKRRSEFTDLDLDEIVKYNELELQYIVKMMIKLRDAHKEAGIHLASWDGAGASAQAMLTQYDVKRYINNVPGRIQEATQYAYAGGRIESIQMGNAPTKKIRRYDKNSCYPSQMDRLPCLIHGQWTHTDGPPVSKFSIVYLKWNLPERPFYPFFYRKDDGTIIFPAQGEGWYWYPEYKTEPLAEVQESWSYICECACTPLKFVKEKYAYRLELKAQGSAAEKAIKLALNSLYGKFAQKAGYKKYGRAPGYHCLAWAGFITSSSRAQLYEAANQHPESVLMFATDAFYSLVEHNLPCSTRIGEWDYKCYDGITIVQAGVYWTREKGKCFLGHKRKAECNAECEWGEKYRGFDRASLNRLGIVDAWRSGSKYNATLTRFIGLGSALSARSYWKHWRSWYTRPRELDIRPTGKRLSAGKFNYATGLHPTRAAFNWNPETPSSIYPLPWLQFTEEREMRFVDGIPFQIVDDEAIDSWAE